MIVFWSSVGGVLALAVVLLLTPYWRSKRTSGVNAKTLSAQLYEQRLTDLNLERDQGTLSATQHEQMKSELDRDFLMELQAEEPQNAQRTGTSGKGTALLTGLLVIGGSLGWYYKTGQPETIDTVPQHAAGKQAQSELPPLEEMVDKLKERLKAEPQDGQGWALLGRTYSILGEYGKASRAYEVAHGIVGDDPELLANYAENVAINNDYQLEGKATKLLEKALSLDPKQPRALWLGGMAAFQQTDYRIAVERWQALLQQMPADSEDVPALQQYIEQAYAEMGEPPPPAINSLAQGPAANPATPPTTNAGTHAIKVTVALDAKLTEQVQPSDTLFIFARAVNGPRAPLAVTRVQASDLPMTIELNDSMAMAPQFKLSAFDKVVVGARISKSGSVTPSSGDLQGISEPLDLPYAQMLSLSINTILP